MGSSSDGGVSALTLHIKNTHFSAIRCRICRVFVAESRAEMSRHVYRTHMYDKKFYNKQFLNLVISNQRASEKGRLNKGNHHHHHHLHHRHHQTMPTTDGSEKMENHVLKQQLQHLHSNQQNIYCIL